MTKLTDRRIAHLIRQAQEGFRFESLGFMAARWGVSKRRLRQVVQHWRNTGEVPRLDPLRRPPAPPLTEEEKRLINEERQRTPRGATKLFWALASRGVHIPKMKIYRYARSQGWVHPNPRKQRPRRRVRYERLHSGSLLHGDWHRTSDQHPVVILWEDDASRMVLWGEEFPETSTDRAIRTLRAALEEARGWGLEVREVNTDRGCEFFSSEREGATPGVSRFQQFLEEQGIRHVVSRVNNPQTNGKLERLWLEYDRHRWRFSSIWGFIDWYNDQIHDALWVELYETPRKAFQRKLPPEVLLGLHERLVEAQA